MATVVVYVACFSTEWCLCTRNITQQHDLVLAVWSSGCDVVMNDGSL